MEMIIRSTPEKTSRVAARMVAKQIRAKPDTVLGLAAGSAPLASRTRIKTLTRIPLR